jgi:Uma2 family endonuclease
VVASPQNSYLSPDEYLQLEEKSEIKHEYIDGQIYAMHGDIYSMAGATDAHVTIAGNLFALVRNHLRGSDCRVYISDMKARIEKLNRFFYPDVMVTCDLRDRETATYKQYPCLIIEVLSDSTEAFDRGDKFADYQTLDSLQEYILINTKRQRVECFRRNNEGFWVLQSYTSENNNFQLKSIDCEGKMSMVYEDVVFE